MVPVLTMKSARYHLVWLLLALGVTNSVLADPFAQGMSAYHTGNYAHALSVWQPLAAAGDIQAQQLVGYLYQHGLGLEVDAVEAARWFMLAAQQGSADAQAELGIMYEIGEGVPKDYWEAERWYQLAIDQGFCPGELGIDPIHVE